ncbi:MAG: PQQ-binding-like beta-propeller repeat protein, partial [Actinobacteria bacterium]|nr:PQQ-binding-like beta-propeller repeat protein [Actinomycetota bacterium]
LQSTTTRGTEKTSIHAVDMTTGQEVWSVDVGGVKPAVGPEAVDIFLSTGDARFITSQDEETFRVVVFNHDTRQLTIHSVPFTTGKDSTTTVDSGIDGTFPYFIPAAWIGPTAIISFRDSGLVVLDTATAKVTYGYP